MEDDIKIPDGNFEVVREQGEYFKAAIKGLVVLNKKITETNQNVVELGKNIKFTAGEIAVFKEAACGMIDKMNTSSNKMLVASRWYFTGSLLLTLLLVSVGFIQWKTMEENSKIMKKQTVAMEKQVESVNKQSFAIERQTAVMEKQVEIMRKQYNRSLPLGSAEGM